MFGMDGSRPPLFRKDIEHVGATVLRIVGNVNPSAKLGGGVINIDTNSMLTTADNKRNGEEREGPIVVLNSFSLTCVDVSFSRW